MSNRFFIGSTVTVCYMIICFVWALALAANVEKIRLEDIIFQIILFCGLLPLITAVAVLKFKKKDENFKLTVCVLFVALLLHYFYAGFAAHSTYQQAVSFFFVNVLITSVMMYFYVRKQQA